MVHCLFVKAPFAGWIVDGVKLIEYRTRNTYIRGRIGIIESGTRTVIGDVELTNCIYDHQFKHYGWEISNPRRYAKPVPFEHKQGCVTWAILDYDPDAQKIAPPLSLRRHCSEVQKYNEAMEEWKRNRWRGGMMSDLPYNAVRVEMDGVLASFIGANGEVLGMRVMCSPRRYRCEGCGRLCHMATYSDRAPECPSSKPEANWLIVNQEEWQKTVRLAPELRNLPTPRAHKKRRSAP